MTRRANQRGQAVGGSARDPSAPRAAEAGRAGWRDPAYVLATGFGAGLIPGAPGTWGTLVGVGVFLAIGGLPWPVYAALTITLFAAGIWACGRAAQRLRRHDHPAIVWDEIVGYLVTMSAAPAGWRWILVGFVLFRLFDIVKPWPIGVVDRRVSGGLGIMLDDLAAGVLAGGCLQLVALLSRHL